MKVWCPGSLKESSKTVLEVIRMPDFKTHITYGLFCYPLYVFLGMAVIELASLPPLVDSRTIGTGYLLFILGSDLADIDSRQALIKRIIEVLIAGVIASIAYSSFISVKIQPVLMSWMYSAPLVVAISFSIAILLGVTLSKALHFLSHRGFFHTFWASLLYGATIAAFLFPQSKLATGNYTYTEVGFLSMAGTVGYCLHLILDFTYASGKKRKRALSKKEENPS